MHVCFILSEHSKSSFVSVINVQTSAICFPLNVLWLSLFFVWLQPSSFQALGHEILFFLITSLSQSFHNQTLATYFLEGKLISFVFSYLSYWSRVPGEVISHIIEVVFFFFPPIDWSKNVLCSISRFSCIWNLKFIVESLKFLSFSLIFSLHRCTLSFGHQSL